MLEPVSATAFGLERQTGSTQRRRIGLRSMKKFAGRYSARVIRRSARQINRKIPWLGRDGVDNCLANVGISSPVGHGAEPTLSAVYRRRE